MSADKMSFSDNVGAQIRMGGRPKDGTFVHGRARFEVYGPALISYDGEEKEVPKKELDDWRTLADLEGVSMEILKAPEFKWAEEQDNLVVNEGLDHVLASTLAGGTQITTWFVGLTDDTPTPAAGDTLASHAGWTEFTEYSEAARQAWTAGAVSGQSVDNSGSVASFSVNNDTNGGLGGAFLASDSTKGGTTGTLYSVVALSGGNRVVNNGDTVEITYTFTSADDGV